MARNYFSNKKPNDDDNKIQEAVALEYDPTSGAPKIIASGRGQIAERIVEKAKENKIAIHKDPELAHTLNMLKIGEEIPPELYDVVAHILVHVSKMDKRFTK